MSWVDDLSDGERRLLSEQGRPEWVAPMLATLTDNHFSDEAWLYERKLDGQRILSFRHGSDIRLMSRNRKNNSGRYPEIVAGLEAIGSVDFVVDGEIVAFDGRVSSFSRLQSRMQLADAEAAKRSGVRVFYYVFDLPHLSGYDVTRLPLRVRKSILKKEFDFSDPIRFTAHRNAEGAAYLEQACKKGWEGLIAKKADSSYRHSRSGDWLKFKCVNRQEFVVGGYTDPQGSRIGFGALLIGVYDDDLLLYAGKVGTGYDDETLRLVHDRLSTMERETPPFTGEDLPARHVHWVAPKLVAEVGFTEWTKDGKLRHPRFLGLRSDKDPQAVVREEPQPAKA